MLYSNINGKAAATHTHSWSSITGKPSLYDSSTIDSKLSSINTMLHIKKLFNTKGEYSDSSTTSTSEVAVTVPNLDEGRVVAAFLSFAGSAQLRATSIILTPLFLKNTNDNVEIRDTVNGISGFIVRKSATSITLRTSSPNFQITCWIY